MLIACSFPTTQCLLSFKFTLVNKSHLQHSEAAVRCITKHRYTAMKIRAGNVISSLASCFFFHPVDQQYVLKMSAVQPVVTRKRAIKFRELADVKLPKPERVRRQDPERLYDVQVLDRDPGNEKVKIHYIGYSSRYDEWRSASEVVQRVRVFASQGVCFKNQSKPYQFKEGIT